MEANGNERNYQERMGYDMDVILSLDVAKMLQKYDEKIYRSLLRKDYNRAEKYLSELCFFFAELPDQDQLFTLHAYFVGIVTDTTKRHRQNSRLHPMHVASSYALIATIDSWKTITDYLTSIDWFIHKIITTLIPGVQLLTQHPTMEKALDLIHRHLRDKELSVAWLAKKMSISTTHLSNTFKCAMDESISQYIQRRKIEEITLELKFSAKPLSEICDCFGYSSLSNFIRTFKSHMGTTPLKYRQTYMMTVKDDGTCSKRVKHNSVSVGS